MYERALLQMACLINKAQAASTLGQYSEAFCCCSLALEIDPRNVRAYHRRAVALLGMDKVEEARHDLEAVLYLDGTHKDAQEMLRSLPAAAPLMHEAFQEETSHGAGKRARNRHKKQNQIA